MRKFVLIAALAVALLGAWGVEVGRATASAHGSAHVVLIADGPTALCGGSASGSC